MYGPGMEASALREGSVGLEPLLAAGCNGKVGAKVAAGDRKVALGLIAEVAVDTVGLEERDNCLAVAIDWCGAGSCS